MTTHPVAVRAGSRSLSCSPRHGAGRSDFSRDGRWLAYQSDETGRTEIFVQPFPPAATKYQVSKNADSHHPLWSPDGKRLFFVPGPYQFVSVNVITQPSFRFGDPVSHPTGGMVEGGPNYPRNYDIMPNGKAFIGVIPSGQAQPGTPAALQIDVVINWLEDLKRLVPTK